MFTLYHSNQLDLLKDLLINLMRREPLSHPLEEEQILVQSPGMAQWLRQEIAEASGIAASITFPMPASFLWNAFVHVLPDVPARSAFNKEAMTWKLMTLLPEMIHLDTFAPLRHYLKDDPDSVRCYQLAGKIADLFDQYLVYRPEWIADWEQGKNSPAEQQPWQPELWRSLVSKTRDSGQPHWHRVNMHQHFLRALNEGNHRNKLPKRLFVFGISAMPPYFIDMLTALSQQTDVHLMVCNPCQYYWGDEKDPKYLNKLATRLFAKEPSVPDEPDGISPNTEGNPLLASMGKLGRDYVHQLYELDAEEVVAFVEGSNKSLLGNIQKDILELSNPAQNHNRYRDRDDKSLVFHSCHSPLREVEVLHDQLLDVFERHPTLTPRDVVVMLPDVDQYSPWINAIFGGLDHHYDNSRFIPYAISDRSARNEYPILPGILQLLTLDNSRCSAPELLELLEIPAIKRRFGFTEEGYEKIRLWVNESGIRWGLSPQHQEGFDLPSRDYNSWSFGIRRMLLGYAMPEEQGLFHEILPLDLAQGMDAQLSGQLSNFIEQAEQFAAQLAEDRSIDQWTVFINALIDAFIEPDEHDEYAMKLVRDALEQLSTQLADVGYQHRLSRPVLLDYLRERLNNERGSQKFLAGKVNFCTLMPMRSIPFKVVCLLGMNDGAYPRSIPAAGFDLMNTHPRRGDRSRREDDRYLFLEALLSAREKLYISYVGNSIKDNSERIPSVLVSELLDYCRGYFDDPDEVSQLVIHHRLQPFSQAHFDDTRPLFSYASEWLPVASAERVKQTSAEQTRLSPMATPDDIELSELLRFFRNPVQYFCNRRLRVYFNAVEAQQEETEPFDLNPLEQYVIKQDLLDVMVSDQDIPRFTGKIKATGKTPYGVFGELFLEDQQKQLTPLTEDILAIKDQRIEDCEVNLSFDDYRLTGWLTHHYSSGLIRFRPAKFKPKDMLATWIEHLCYCCTEPRGDSRIYSIDKIASFNIVAPDDARQMLSGLIEHYLEGHNRPLPFFPTTAFQWYETLLKTDEAQKAEAGAKKAFYGGFKSHGESSDEYLHRFFPQLEPEHIFEPFTSLAEQIYAPAFDHLTLHKRGNR